jgi:uncharacterized protein (TIGR02001 family)
MNRTRTTFLKKTISISAVLAANCASINLAHAQGEVSYSAGIVSEYLWRGFELNDEKPALQGSVDYQHESGFYAGVWASQYDFGDNDDGIEVDIYGGYSLDLNDDFWLDFSVTSYQYSGDSDASLEWKIGFGHEFFELNYYHDQDLDTDYVELNSSYPLNDTWSINGHIGSNDDGEDSYYDYAVFTSFAFNENIEFTGGYSDHELDEKGAEGTFFLGVFASF